MFSFFNVQKGYSQILVLASILGILVFIFLAGSAPLKDNLLTTLFPKADTKAATPVDQPPFNWPHQFPGKLEAEDFDDGGEGKAYSDTDPTNLGGGYRINQAVDLYPTSDTGGGYVIGSTKAGEWVEYYVNVTNSGTYNLVIRASANGNGGKIHFGYNTEDLTGTLTVPNTGGLDTYQDILVSGIYLTAGEHTFRLSFDTESTAGNVGNFNFIEFQAVSLIYPTAPTIDTSGFCGNPSSGVIISWTADAIKYNQIAEDSTFSTWYNKYVVNAPNNFTLAPVGFSLRQTDPPLPLDFIQGKTYFIRIWDGANISPVTSFTIPNCSSPAPSKPGDIDGNGKVDIFDFNILLTNFGKSGSGIAGDLDGNNKVDIFDYNLLLSNFGK